LSGRDDPFLDDYVKWLALYSEMSIFVMPFAMECVDITYSSHYGAELEKSWKDLKTLVRYSRQYRQLLDSGMGVFLPAENTYTLTSYSDHRTDTYKAPLTQVPDQYIYTPINSRSNIFMGTSFQDFMVYKEIVLPYFKIPRLDELIKIAKNETQSFVKFNHFLAKKLANISKADSGTKLQEILREIDYEVANIELEFKRLGRLRVLQGVEMAFFSISLSALLFADADLVKQIAGVSGSVSLLEIFKGFFSRSEQGSSVKTNDFYLPYLLKTKNG
jgi:hypothetical protein